MKITNTLILRFSILFIVILFANSSSNAQVTEWRLVNVGFNSTDPDGGGPATGSATFKLQIHTTGATIPNINVITAGWSYNDVDAMVPTTPGCSIVSNPANVAMSSTFSTAGFTYTVVNQCNIVNFTIGGETYTRRAVGTVDGGLITLTPTWIDIFTVTLWTKGTVIPEGGSVLINSGSSSTSSLMAPELFTTYSVSDDIGTEFPLNSLTLATPIELSSAILPVQFSKFVTNCNSNGTSIEWATTQEINASKYEVEKSLDGNNWKSIATVQAAGNSSNEKTYQQLDLNSGKAFYRIKQIDADGKFTYTGIESTNCTPKNIDVVIYPVPAKDRLNVAISSNKNINTNFAIYDATGRVVKKFNQKITIGNNAIQIDVNNLPSGQYIIKSTDEYTNINKKFTIFK